MRLISKFRDYYDGVLHSMYRDNEHTWVRESLEVPAMDLGFNLDRDILPMVGSLLLVNGRAYPIYGSLSKYDLYTPITRIEPLWDRRCYEREYMQIPREGKEVSPEVFRSVQSPLILIHRLWARAQFEWVVNPCLAALNSNFQHMFPCIWMAQELDRYVSNELVRERDIPYYTGGDDIIRDSKGFDEESFISRVGRKHRRMNK